MVDDKVLFSVIRKTKNGAVLRNTRNGIEKEFTWDEIKAFFNREGSDWLYSWNPDNPFEDEINELSKQMSKELAEITPFFLLLRNGRGNPLVFGVMVEKFCEKHGVSIFDFVQIFQSYFKSVFGVHPSFEGVLEIKDRA